MNVNVKATASGQDVHVDIDVDGRHAVVTFADGEITMEVPAEEGDLTMVVPESVAAVDPAG